MVVRGWGRTVAVTALVAGCSGDAGTEARFTCFTGHAADPSCLVGSEYCALTMSGGERFARCAPMPARCAATDPSSDHPCPCLRSVLVAAGATNVDCGARPLAAGWATTTFYTP